jgi:hypothetical protein
MGETLFKGAFEGVLKNPRNAVYVILIPPLAGEESKNFNKL